MQYLINGQKPLQGMVSISGAKNASLKLIIAALLTDGVSRIDNVPRIRDVVSLLEIINYLGGEAKFIAKNTVQVENKLKSYHLPLEIGGKTRVSILLIAPLLHQFNQAILPNPGGCRLGERSVDRLIDSLKKMGARISYLSEDGYYHAKITKTKTAVINFAKKSHTGTELAMMFASRIPVKTVINNAAQEPEIDDLIVFLNQAGAKIRRQGQQILVTGKKRLSATQFEVQPDRIEAVTFIVLSALFDGRIMIKNVTLKSIMPFLKPFTKAGFDYQYNQEKQLLKIVQPKSIKPVSIVTAPHPGFLTDWQPLWTILMTQAQGSSTVHETVFENRLGYIQDLKRFGCKIDFYQPEVSAAEEVYQFNNYNPYKHRYQAIKIHGPTTLHNAYATMTDIRAGACLVLAALIAKGNSVISGAEQIERGYEDLLVKLTKLGAQARVVNSQ